MEIQPNAQTTTLFAAKPANSTKSSTAAVKPEYPDPSLQLASKIPKAQRWPEVSAVNSWTLSPFVEV